MVRVSANGLVDRGSILGRVISKTQKWYLMPPCLTLSIIRYGSRVKWSNPRKGIAPSPTPRCSSYWKGSLRVALDYGRQLYLFMLWGHFCQIKSNCHKWFETYLKILSNSPRYSHLDDLPGINKINEIKRNVKRNAETPRSPWQEVGWRIHEKRTVPTKRIDSFSLFS